MPQTTTENAMAKGMPGQLISKLYAKGYVNNSRHTFLVTAATGGTGVVHSIVVNSTTYSHTETALQTAANIAAALIALITAGGESVVMTDNADGTFVIETATLGTAITVTGSTYITVLEALENNHTVPFGVMVVQDDESGTSLKAHPPFTSAQVTGARSKLGVTIHDHSTNEQALVNANNVGYDNQSVMSVLKQGEIYVQVEEAVTPASIPHIRFAPSSNGTQLGAVRASTDGGTAAPLSIARFSDNAATLGVAGLNINWP